MKTREEIITGMCYTFRHDYGLDKSEYTGMSKEEREQLYKSHIWYSEIGMSTQECRQ